MEIPVIVPPLGKSITALLHIVIPPTFSSILHLKFVGTGSG